MEQQKQQTLWKTKVCIKCHQEKPVTEFYRHKRSKDGYSCYCKECQKTIATKSMEKKREEKVISENKASAIRNTVNQSPLSKFKPRELIQELSDRGYHGECEYVYKIKF